MKMTNEWIDWSCESRIRTPLRSSGGCNNYLNNNYAHSNKMATGMGHKVQSMMRSFQRPKGSI